MEEGMAIAEHSTQEIVETYLSHPFFSMLGSQVMKILTWQN